MTVALYMDVHVRGAITGGLRHRGVDVLTAQEDRPDRLDDPALLDRASALGRVLFSQDADLLREAARRQRASEVFAGLVYCHQHSLTVGQIVADLEILAKVSDPPDVGNRVVYLPL